MKIDDKRLPLNRKHIRKIPISGIVTIRAVWSSRVLRASIVRKPD